MTARWNDFLDRVYGCWLGKCASSGASPARGLDIQILWLDVLMRVGPECTAADLAHAFYAEYSEEDGDYTALRKNCARGLCPPLTATFNNPGGAEDTGCAARAEIWACMAPGDPSLAASLAGTDASVDHTGDAAEAEKYLAALGALAFTGKQDVRGLVVCALEYIDKNTRLYEMAGKVLAWCERRPDRDFVYGRILRDYGHTNCRHVLQNMGFVLLSLLLGGGDYRESVALVRACGFDADSNCAAVGALLGIMLGGETMINKYDLHEQRISQESRSRRCGAPVYGLATDVARTALLFLPRNRKMSLKDAPEDKKPKLLPKGRFPVSCTVSYAGDDPVIRPGQSRTVRVRLAPLFKMKVSGTVRLQAPEGFTVKPDVQPFRIGLFNPELQFTVSVPKDIPVLMERNLLTCTVQLENGDRSETEFGMVGVQLWKIYGPFWEQDGGAHPRIRADWQKEYLEDPLLGEVSLPEELVTRPEYRGFPVYLSEDLFTFESLMHNTMPCVIYMVRDVYAPEDMQVGIRMGHSDVFRLWKDGDLLAYSDCVEPWTPDSAGCCDIVLRRGLNRFVLKLARTVGTGAYSLLFTKGDGRACPVTELGSGRAV